MITEKVRNEMITAMKSGNKERKESAKMLLNALTNKAKEKLAALTEDEEIAVLSSELKQLNSIVDEVQKKTNEVVAQYEKQLAGLATKENSDSERLEILAKIEKAKADNVALIEKANAKNASTLELLTELLPAQLGEADVREIIEDVLKQLGIENPSNKDKGAIMKVLMPLVKGKADGKLVNTLVATYLQ